MDDTSKRNQLAKNQAYKEQLEKKVESFDILAPVDTGSFDEALENMAAFLLFDTKVWQEHIVKNRKILQKFPLIMDMPLVCKATKCVYASKCSVLKKVVNFEDQTKMEETDCKDEKIYSVNLFVDLVKELSIGPDATSDLLLVSSLVRLHVMRRRINWSIAIDGMTQEEPAVASTKTNHVYWKKTSHPLLRESERIERQINILFSQLVASRKDKLAAAASLGKRNDLADLFSGSFEKAAAIEADYQEMDAEEDE